MIVSYFIKKEDVCMKPNEREHEKDNDERDSGERTDTLDK